MNTVPRMVRHVDRRTGVPQARFTTQVIGERQIRIYQAMCQLAERRPHELAGDILLTAIRQAQHDPELQRAVARLSQTLDAGKRPPACRMCGCTDDAACVGSCRWVADPLRIGHLCSACHPIAALSEVDAHMALLARLPEADAAELLALAGTCPESSVQALLPQLTGLLDQLRTQLIDLVAEAHQHAVEAEALTAEGDEAHASPADAA